jgi:hypothetical protein
LQYPPHGVGQVQRQVEDDGLGESLAGQALTGRGGGGDGDDVRRQRVAQRMDEGLGRQHLTHRDRMNPDGPAACACLPQPLEPKAKPLGQAMAVVPTQSHADQPHRCA